MRRKKTNSVDQYLCCPCCGKDRPMSSAKWLQDADFRTVSLNAHPWRPETGWAVNAAKEKKIRWACDICLSSGKAIKAHPWLQQFCDYSPYMAYYDQEKQCKRCKNLFIFSAKEQQFWYEELKFWVQSVPNECAACRKTIRDEKQKHKDDA